MLSSDKKNNTVYFHYKSQFINCFPLIFLILSIELKRDKVYNYNQGTKKGKAGWRYCSTASPAYGG